MMIEERAMRPAAMTFLDIALPLHSFTISHDISPLRNTPTLLPLPSNNTLHYYSLPHNTSQGKIHAYMGRSCRQLPAHMVTLASVITNRA